MRLRKTLGALLAIGVVCCCSPSRAAVVLTNGSYETTGTRYTTALGGLYQASGWTNLSSLSIQASSMLAGQEGTPAAGATGSRILRLVSDNPHPANTGFIVQNLGTMVAGETYTLTADAFGGGSVGHLWGATAQLTSDASVTPATVYDTQFVDNLSAGAFVPGAFSLSHTATAGDNGHPLFLWLRAKGSGPGQATRGGIDNWQLIVIPEPATLSLVGLGALGLVASRKRK